MLNTLVQVPRALQGIKQLARMGPSGVRVIETYSWNIQKSLFCSADNLTWFRGVDCALNVSVSCYLTFLWQLYLLENTLDIPCIVGFVGCEAADR